MRSSIFPGPARWYKVVLVRRMSTAAAVNVKLFPRRLPPGGSQMFVLCRRRLVPGNCEGDIKDQRRFKRREGEKESIGDE